MRRCVGMGGGALLGDFVGGGAGAANLAILAAMAEALPEDFGVAAASFPSVASAEACADRVDGGTWSSSHRGPEEQCGLRGSPLQKHF